MPLLDRAGPGPGCPARRRADQRLATASGVATDPQRHLVEMPLVAGASASSTQPSSYGGAELDAPLTDGFVADDEPRSASRSCTSRKRRWKRKYSQTA